jgi:competence protein ComEC
MFLQRRVPGRDTISGMKALFAALLLLGSASLLPAARNLEVYFIDVEGGQSTLLVSPSGESMLIDTGWAGHNHRDAQRIAAAAKAAGVKKIDYLVITHYHADHVGGVPQLAEKLPIVNFVDHGPNNEHGKDADILYNAYIAQRDKGKHILAKPGDTIPIKGLDVTVLSANGDVIGTPLPGAGKPNPECASFQKRDVDTTENARSVGMLVRYGDFRLLDLGDLTWNKEYDLVCPNNKIGPVDVYVVSHHGMNMSGSPQMVHAIAPRVAVMDNGARKGGAPEVWQTIHDTPGLEALWQLHFAVAGGQAHNSPDTFIANVDEICQGQWLRLTVQKDGSYTIYNSRNKYEQTYAKR